VSIAATPITDACALKAVELIAKYLRTAVAQGDNLEAREQLAYAQFLAGMAFNVQNSAARPADVAVAMGVAVDKAQPEAGAQACLAAIEGIFLGAMTA
jgi:alcohol dehydrogenase